jgi:hypothetical protein
MQRTAYLFDPTRVVELLRELPNLRRALRDPQREGVPSSAFPLARKSQRQLYRILGNSQYAHLHALLRSLDFCVGRGFVQPAVLRSRARKSFASGLSEVAAAEHFLLRGFDVEGLDIGKGSDPVPEFRARRDGLRLAVEVYRPTAWEGLSALTEELTDALKNLDVPHDYGFEVRLEPAERFDAKGGLLRQHPATLAVELSAVRRVAIVDLLVDRIEAQIAGGASTADAEVEERDLNLRVSVALRGVGPSRGDLPARWGSTLPLALSGHAPDAMFDRLVRQPVRRKAARGQARDEDGQAVLIVDLGGSEITAELGTSVYLERFVESIRRVFGPTVPGYDLIAFTEFGGWGLPLVPHIIHHGGQPTEETLRSMFGNHLVGSP